MKRCIKTLSAALISLFINFVSLYVLIHINHPVEARQEQIETNKKPIVINEPPPRKQPRPRLKPTKQVRSIRPQTSSIPNLLSPVSIPNIQLSNDVAIADFSNSVGEDLDAISADFVFKEDAVDTPPKVLSRAMPTYPWWAEKSGKEGFVEFRLKLNAQGRIERIWVEHSEPVGVFDEAAKKAIRKYRFSPAIFNGKAVPVICKQKIVFQLGD